LPSRTLGRTTVSTRPLSLPLERQRLPSYEKQISRNWGSGIFNKEAQYLLILDERIKRYWVDWASSSGELEVTRLDAGSPWPQPSHAFNKGTGSESCQYPPVDAARRPEARIC